MEEDNLWKPDYLSIGPGGSKGFYVIGCLHKLNCAGILDKIKGYVGCSVGSMICLLLNVGYKPVEVMTIASTTSMFNDFFSLTLTERMKEAKKNIGLISNKSIKSSLSVEVERKCGYLPTLQQLYEETGLELYITTCDVDSGESVYISHYTHPNMSAVNAVMLSINIPIIFYKIQYKNKTYTDGGFVDPVPIAPVDDGNNNILSITMKTIKNDSSTLTGYMHHILSSPIDQLSKYIIYNSSHRCRFIRIYCSIKDLTGATVENEDKAMMFLEGVESAKRYIKKCDNFYRKYNLGCNSSDNFSEELQPINKPGIINLEEVVREKVISYESSIMLRSS